MKSVALHPPCADALVARHSPDKAARQHAAERPLAAGLRIRERSVQPTSVGEDCPCGLRRTGSRKVTLRWQAELARSAGGCCRGDHNRIAGSSWQEKQMITRAGNRQCAGDGWSWRGRVNVRYPAEFCLYRPRGEPLASAKSGTFCALASATLSERSREQTSSRPGRGLWRQEARRRMLQHHHHLSALVVATRPFWDLSMST
jgi:hypothetical protein